MTWPPRADVLTFEEIERLARLIVERYGVESIRLTGGEPIVRAHLPVLVAKLAACAHPAGPVDLAMYDERGDAPAHRPTRSGHAGCTGSTSAWTRSRDRFAEMTRRDELHRVLDGIEAADEAGVHRSRSTSSSSATSTTTRSSSSPGRRGNGASRLRFIECTPLDALGGWDGRAVVGQDEIVARIEAVHPLEQVPALGAAPPTAASRPGTADRGVIPSATSRSAVPSTGFDPPTGSGPACSRRRSSFCCGRRAGVKNGTTTARGRAERPSGAKWAGHHINQVRLRPSQPLDEPMAVTWTRRVSRIPYPRDVDHEPGPVVQPSGPARAGRGWSM